MGSCLSTKTYYYDNRHYNNDYNSYHTSRIENRIQQFPTDDEGLRQRAERYASKIENQRSRNGGNSRAKTYEELRKQAENELGNDDPRDGERLEIFYKIPHVCYCEKFHILYRRSSSHEKHNESDTEEEESLSDDEESNHLKNNLTYLNDLRNNLECAHMNRESDWKKFKFRKICEDCQISHKFCHLTNQYFHRMYLNNDGYSINHYPPFRAEMYESENPSRRDILSKKLQKLQRVCDCAKSHILYWSANHQDNWYCAHLNGSDWRKSKFNRLCDDCRAIVTLGWNKNTFHRMYLGNDNSIHKKIDVRFDDGFRIFVQ